MSPFCRNRSGCYIAFSAYAIRDLKKLSMSQANCLLFKFGLALVVFALSADARILAKDAEGTNSSVADPTVTTDCGQLRGKVVTTPKGKCDAYLGVPFAAPPIGDLRWKKPQPLQCWSETKVVKEYAPRCIPTFANGTDPKEFSEDCLYANILVPKSANASKNLPVMVFIHGGGYLFGSASDFGDEGPCENLASRGVIVVFIQYRLFLYGFFSTGDNSALGNYGVWDQIEALKWIKGNIGKFGGDPNRVTVFGESAGGASVSYLTYTPVAKDLFQQSIAESGSAKSYWAALSDKSIESAKKLAEHANCNRSDINATVQCLRALSIVELQSIYNSALNATDPLAGFGQWQIRVDGELFNEGKFQELNSGKPAIIGVNSAEYPADVKNIPMAEALWSKTLEGTFKGNNSVENEVLKQVAKFAYIDSKGDRDNDTFLCQQFGKFITDSSFHSGAADEATSKANSGPTWVYNFDYYSQNVFKPDYPFEKGAPHAHELCYLFLLYVPPEASKFLTCPLKYEGVDRQVSDYLGEMWTNFAIKGNPSPKDVEWPQFHNVSNANAMTVRSNLSIDPHFYIEAANFWNYLKPNIDKTFANNA